MELRIFDDFPVWENFFVDWLMLICTFNIMLHFISRNKSSRRLCLFFRCLLLCMLCQCVIAISVSNIQVINMWLFFSVDIWGKMDRRKKEKEPLGKNLLGAMSTNHQLQGCYQIMMWQKQASLTCKKFLQNPLGMFMLPWLHVAWWKSILTTSD